MSVEERQESRRLSLAEYIEEQLLKTKRIAQDQEVVLTDIYGDRFGAFVQLVQFYAKRFSLSKHSRLSKNSNQFKQSVEELRSAGQFDTTDVLSAAQIGHSYYKRWTNRPLIEQWGSVYGGTDPNLYLDDGSYVKAWRQQNKRSE